MRSQPVPEPPAAPTQRVVGPPRSHGDADGQEAPGCQRPGPDPARPGGVYPALDQRCDGKREGYREADIAQIEEWRVEGEAGILQHRVEAAAVRWRRKGAQERVRG